MRMSYMAMLYTDEEKLHYTISACDKLKKQKNGRQKQRLVNTKEIQSPLLDFLIV